MIAGGLVLGRGSLKIVLKGTVTVAVAILLEVQAG